MQVCRARARAVDVGQGQGSGRGRGLLDSRPETFSTSQPQLPKVVREWLSFVHFDFKMYFAPQRRALFRHRTSQLPKVVRTPDSEPGVFCTF